MVSEPKGESQMEYEKSMKSRLYGIDISFTVLATIAVVLRFWARHRSAGSHGWDDWLVIIAVTILFISLALNAIMIENGLGLQAKDVPLSQTITIGKALFWETIAYLILIATVKMAILVMYCRVFPLRSFRITSWILATVVNVWTLMFVLLNIFQCKPVARAWDPTIDGKCLNVRAGYIGNAIPNILTDLFILAMPMWHVWQLHIRLAQRLAVTGIFLLGAFVIMASIYRFTRILHLDMANLSYTLKQPATWSHVELSTAVICACLPVMRPLLTAFLCFVGLNNKPTQQSGSVERSERASKSLKKKPETGLTEFSVLDEGRGGWTTPPKTESNDELPLNTIHVHKEYEQKVETNPKAGGWLDDRMKKSWYPGN